MSQPDASQSELEALREFVTAWALVDKGVTDFDLQNGAVARLTRAVHNPHVEELIREAIR